MGRVKRKRVEQEEESIEEPNSKRKSQTNGHKQLSTNITHQMNSDNTSSSGSEDADSSEHGSDEEGGSNKDPLSFHEKKKTTVHSARELPSAQELKSIFEASELFKGNAFKIQIENLLPSVSSKSSQTARAPLEAFLMKLHSHLLQSHNSIANKPQNPVDLAAKLLSQQIAVPFPSRAPTKETKWTFKYEKPDNIVVVGSWASGTAVKHKDGVPFGVDLEVVMPASMFQEKDYLNDRYFHKRALYLACIASAISKNLEVDINYESLSDDSRQTILVITPKKGSPHDWSKLNAVIRIIPTLPNPSPIPATRFSPTSSNLRIADHTQDQTEAPSTSHPTPHHNSLLSASQLPTSLLLTIHKYTTTIPNFVPAVRLLRVWANQRGFGRGEKGSILGFDCLGPWWACILGVLVNGEEPLSGSGKKGKNMRRTLGRGLSSYQLFRGALDFLASHDFEKEPVFMKTNEGRHKFSPDSWISTGRPVFIEPSSTTNLLENVPFGSLALLRLEAAQTLKVLDGSSNDSFASTFLQDLRQPRSRFDIVLRVSLDGIQLRKEDPVDILDRGSYLSSAFASMDKILRQALGNRAKSITILCSGNSPRPLTQAQPASAASLEIGLVLDPENAFRLIDRGPKVDDDVKIIAAFRDFWGEKAELRRFADGSIVECVAWEVEAPHQRAYIPSQIVRHTLERHFNLKKIKDAHPSYDELIYPSKPRPGVSTGKEGGYKVAMQAFDELVKQIKAMDLPLSLVACLPCAEELRYTSVLLPSPTPLTRLSTLPDCAKYVAVYDAVLQFEKSARWPDDLGAIQKLKLAWFEKVAKELMEKLPGSQVCIAMDAFASPVEDSASLEVVLASGFAFRLRIYHDREKTLLENTLKDKSTLAFQKVDAEKAFSVHQGRFIHAPRHHAAIMNMHHRHVGYSPTVRLVKRWFSSHLLSNTVSIELIELLCAHIFLRTDPQLIPHTGASGFARVIAFLSEWQWRTEPVLIPIHSMAGLVESAFVQFPAETRQIAEDGFKERRAVDPGMSSGAWHIATEQDSKGVLWCLEGNGPTPMIAERVKLLAKASWQCIEKGQEDGFSVKALFTHPFNDYDFLVHLNPAVLPRYTQSSTVDDAVWSKEDKFVNISSRIADETMLGFDPAREFVEDLQRTYGDTIAFFYDIMGGTVITGSWNPLLRDSKPFRALLGYSGQPENGKKKGQVVLNEDAVLAEIARMGQGLVKEIVKQGR